MNSEQKIQRRYSSTGRANDVQRRWMKVRILLAPAFSEIAIN